MASSNGDSAVSSSTKSPSSESSSSPIGFSSDTGSCAIRRMSFTSRAVHWSSRAISSGVGSRPNSCTSWRSTCTTLLSFSTMWTGDADRARLVGDRARDRLADPPGRVRRELVAAPVVELLDGADQAERALLDQVQERQPAAQVALRDRDDEPQVRLDHLLLGDHVAALDALGERDLLVGGQQVDAPDRAQVQPQRVEARLDGQVDLGLLRRVLLLGAGGLRHARSGRRPRDDLDACVQEVQVRIATCSFVTSTSSRQAAISSKVRNPRSRPRRRARAAPRSRGSAPRRSPPPEARPLVLLRQPLAPSDRLPAPPCGATLRVDSVLDGGPRRAARG